MDGGYQVRLHAKHKADLCALRGPYGYTLFDAGNGVLLYGNEDRMLYGFYDGWLEEPSVFPSEVDVWQRRLTPASYVRLLEALGEEPIIDIGGTA
jgi:hypothetical protein